MRIELLLAPIARRACLNQRGCKKKKRWYYSVVYLAIATRKDRLSRADEDYRVIKGTVSGKEKVQVQKRIYAEIWRCLDKTTIAWRNRSGNARRRFRNSGSIAIDGRRASKPFGMRAKRTKVAARGGRERISLFLRCENERTAPVSSRNERSSSRSEPQKRATESTYNGHRWGNNSTRQRTLLPTWRWQKRPS